jgi:anti-anti-sigma regulatory factor
MSELSGYAEDAVTLRLHGALSREGSPSLQAVLDGVVLLQPTRLIIDLSDVTSVSADAMRMLSACAVADGDVVLRSPDRGPRGCFIGG